MKRTVLKLSLMEIWNGIQTLKVGRNFFCIVGISFKIVEIF